MPRESRTRQILKRLLTSTTVAIGFSASVCPQIAAAQPMADANAIAPSAPSQDAGTGCALPSEPSGIPAALDAAITGPADKDRACMKALLTPDARIMSVEPAADGGSSHKLLTLDDWIAGARARGHVVFEEKQINFRIDRFGTIAHLWSLYTLRSGGNAVGRGINSIQAIREAGGWRIAEIMVQAESPKAPLPEKYVP